MKTPLYTRLADKNYRLRLKKDGWRSFSCLIPGVLYDRLKSYKDALIKQFRLDTVNETKVETDTGNIKPSVIEDLKEINPSPIITNAKIEIESKSFDEIDKIINEITGGNK